jgi:hypothetical protein
VGPIASLDMVVKKKSLPYSYQESKCGHPACSLATILAELPSSILLEKLIVTQLVKKFSPLSWNPKVHCLVYKSPPLVPVLSHMHPFHILPSYFLKIHSNIIFTFTPRSYEWYFPFRFSTKILYAFLISPMHATCPTHLVLLDWITLIIFGKVHISGMGNKPILIHNHVPPL